MSYLYSYGGIRMDTKNKLSMVSLFCGAGGLDMGFERQGFQTVWANDLDEDACKTHQKWSDAKIVHGDIGKIDFNTIPATDIISGGFPCQGFSLAGPRKLDDSRNILYRYFVKLVELKRPRAFIAENVKGILTLGNGTIIEAIINDFKEKGYNITVRLVNAADYGVPQDRYRVIIIGFRNDLDIKFEFPHPLKEKVTLKDVLKELPNPQNNEVCLAPYSSRYMSRNRKRNWDEQSFTIPAMAKQVSLYPGSPDMIKIGADLWCFGDQEKTRRLSYKEAAAIQTFPQNMVFCGDLTSKYKQIGNAVPVKLAEVIAAEIYKALEGEYWEIRKLQEKPLSMHA